MTCTRPLALAALALTALALAGAAVPVSARTHGPLARAAVVPSDFNGDGSGDLAIGVPYEDVGAVIDAGAVNVVYGSPTGLGVAGNQLWHQGSTGVTGVAETGDHFGAALAPGDFDGDGITDLAIGISDESTDSVADAGGVQILRGTRTGLVAWKYWNLLNASGNAVGIELLDSRFGAALAAGDFNGDGRDDLAVGMPEATGGWGDLPESVPGKVVALYGSRLGLASSGSQIFSRHQPRSLDDRFRRFGASLAAGDHNGDGIDDLAVGAPGRESDWAGDAWVYFGSRGTLSRPPGLGTSVHLWYAPVDIPNFGPRTPAGFGAKVAMGDVDGDGTQEVFVGAPFDDPGGVVDAGSVFESHYAPNATAPTASHVDGWKRQYTQRALPGVAAEASDRFGWSLAVGDFDRNGSPDLAVGTPNEDTTAGADAGIVTVLSSYGGVLDTQSAKTWSQASTGVPGTAEAGDRFGAALAACNLGSGLATDLAIGVPLEDFTAGGLTRSNAGVVDVLYGSTSGLGTTNVQDWSQASTGLLGGFEENDQFGYVLAC